MARRKNELIKSPNQKTPYTIEQIQELKRCKEDVVYFCKNYVKVRHPVKGSIPFNLYPYQEEMMRLFQDNRYSIVLSARQTGKNFFIHTPICTPTGFKTMGDLQPGDEVIGGDGKPTKVLWVSDVTTDKKCFEVTFSTGETVIASDTHEWVVNHEKRRKTKNYRNQVLTTQNMIDLGVSFINNRGYQENNFSIDVTPTLDLPEVVLPVDPYILGVWLGDGATNGASITSHINDTDIHNQIISRWGIERCSFYKSKHDPKKQNVFSINIRELRPKLKEIGVFGNKHIPQLYLRASATQRLELLRGLMDTDGFSGGTKNGSKRPCELAFSNKRLADDAHELISSLGIKSCIKIIKTKCKDSHRIVFTAYKEQHPIFHLQRKLNSMKSINDEKSTRSEYTKKRFITSIIPVEPVPVKCIAVDNEDKTYCFGRSFIKTHNSQTSAIYLLWYAMFNKDKTILIVSNKNSGAMEMIYRIQYAYQELPGWLKPGVMDDGWNKHSLGFDNGCRILSEATSEDSGRGMSLTTLFCDEFGFVPANIQETFWTSISPTLATGGSCIITSTPNGDSNLFAQMWRSAQTGALVGETEQNIAFKPMQVKWDEPPGRDEKFKQQQIAIIGELKWRQEYECEFLSTDALLIDTIVTAQLENRVKNTKSKVINGYTFWKDPKPGETYIIGIDPASGSGSDFSVIECFHFPSVEQVAEFRSNQTSSSALYTKLKWLVSLLENAGCSVYFSVENNGVGEGVVALYTNDESPFNYTELVSESTGNRLGMNTNVKTKIKACMNFKEMLEKGRMIIYSKTLFNEIKNFVRKRASYQAQAGATDDCIAACLVVVRILEEIASYEQGAFEKLYTYDEEKQEYRTYNNDGDEEAYEEPMPMSIG